MVQRMEGCGLMDPGSAVRLQKARLQQTRFQQIRCTTLSEMIRLRKQIDQKHLFDAIARSQQDHQIASQGHQIAGDIDNAWRAQGRQHTRHALSQANSRRVDHRQVGLMKSMRGELCPSRSAPYFAHRSGNAPLWPVPQLHSRANCGRDRRADVCDDSTETM